MAIEFEIKEIKKKGKGRPLGSTTKELKTTRLSSEPILR